MEPRLNRHPLFVKFKPRDKHVDMYASECALHRFANLKLQITQVLYVRCSLLIR